MFGGVAAATIAPFLPAAPVLTPLALANGSTLAFHPDAFAMVSPANLGISMRMMKGYDITQDQHPSRFDIFMVQPEIREDA